MPFVALATCLNIPEPDVDEALLVRALERAGVEARVLAWDDPRVDWQEPRLTVLRSTWNYYLSPGAFLTWVKVQGERLVNAPAVVAWNHHKRYLRELEAAGLPVVPTLWFDQELAREYPTGSTAKVERLAARGWTDVVVKPAISAGSHQTFRIKGPPFDARRLRELVAAGDTMAQPYVASVETYGERSVVWIDGEVTHAVRKSPRFKGESELVSDVMPVSVDERQRVTEVLAQVPGSPVYARVDLLRDASGSPMIGEVELIEPSLYLRQSPEALARFASAIASRFRTRGAS